MLLPRDLLQDLPQDTDNPSCTPAPTPEEIMERCELIQVEWSEKDRESRRVCGYGVGGVGGCLPRRVRFVADGSTGALMADWRYHGNFWSD